MSLPEALSFRYALHELPRGRYPFRRWRWELWHRDRLEASGWRVSEPEAARALRHHGARVGHRLFGLPAPDRTLTPPPDLAPGRAVLLRHGALAFTLVPLGLEEQRDAAPDGSGARG